MKAAIYTKGRSGKILEMKDLEQPVPQDNEMSLLMFSGCCNRTAKRLQMLRRGFANLSAA